MGGKSNPITIPSPRGGARAAQEEPLQTAAAAVKAVAAGAVAAGRGTRPCVALNARALFQELGVAMAAWHHSASAVRYPRLRLDCTMGQLTEIMGGLDDVIIDDVNINDADVAGRRTRIRRLDAVVATTTVVAGRWRRTGWGGNNNVKGATQSVIKRGSDAGREVAIQQPAGAREMVVQRERRRCNNQPARERRSARRETVAQQERGGVVRQGVTRAAEQKAMRHDSK